MDQYTTIDEKNEELFKEGIRLKVEGEQLYEQGKAQEKKNLLASKMLDMKEDALKQREAELEEKEKQLEERVAKETEKLSEDKVKKIKEKYAVKTMAFYSLCFCALAYGIWVTFLSSSQNREFFTDMLSVFKKIASALSLFGAKWVETSIDAGKYVGNFFAGNDVLVFFCGNISGFIVFLIIFLILASFSYRMLLKLFTWYQKHLGDAISLAAFLIPFALIAMFAEKIKSLVEVNVFLLLLFTHIVYIIVRLVYGNGKKEAKKN